VEVEYGTASMLKGNYQAMQISQGEAAFRKAIELQQQAIKLDPGYAPAYGALAIAFMELGGWHSTVSPRSVYRPAREAALRAVEIDPDLPEGHIALARLRQLFEWDWEEADREYRRGIELNPGSALALILYANYLTAMGRSGEAIEVAGRALELDPLSPMTYNELGWALTFAGCFDEAEQRYREGLEIAPDFQQSHALLVWLYDRIGRSDKALKHLDLFAWDKRAVSLGHNGYQWARAGRKDTALSILEELKERRKTEFVPAFPIAEVCIGLDRTEEALQWLETAYQERDILLVWLKELWVFDPLRSDPRFQDLLRRMNFPA